MTHTNHAQFKFRLATLLRLRENERDEQRLALAEAQHADDILRRAAAFVEQELHGLHERYRRAMRPGLVDLDRLVEAQRYELALHGRQEQLAAERETLAAEIERRRQALVEADREVRVLEKLRQRRSDQHRDAEDYRTTRELDEIGHLRAVQEVAG